MNNELTTDDLLKFIGKLYVEKEMIITKNNELVKMCNKLKEEKDKLSQESKGD